MHHEINRPTKCPIIYNNSPRSLIQVQSRECTRDVCPILCVEFWRSQARFLNLQFRGTPRLADQLTWHGIKVIWTKSRTGRIELFRADYGFGVDSILFHVVGSKVIRSQTSADQPLRPRGLKLRVTVQRVLRKWGTILAEAGGIIEAKTQFLLAS